MSLSASNFKKQQWQQNMTNNIEYLTTLKYFFTTKLPPLVEMTPLEDWESGNSSKKIKETWPFWKQIIPPHRPGNTLSPQNTHFLSAEFPASCAPAGKKLGGREWPLMSQRVCQHAAYPRPQETRWLQVRLPASKYLPPQIMMISTGRKIILKVIRKVIWCE